MRFFERRDYCLNHINMAQHFNYFLLNFFRLANLANGGVGASQRRESADAQIRPTAMRIIALRTRASVTHRFSDFIGALHWHRGYDFYKVGLF